MGFAYVKMGLYHTCKLDFPEVVDNQMGPSLGGRVINSTVPLALFNGWIIFLFAAEEFSRVLFLLRLAAGQCLSNFRLHDSTTKKWIPISSLLRSVLWWRKACILSKDEFPLSSGLLFPLSSVTWISSWAAHSTSGSVIAAIMPGFQLTEGLSWQHTTWWSCFLTHRGHNDLYPPTGLPKKWACLQSVVPAQDIAWSWARNTFIPATEKEGSEERAGNQKSRCTGQPRYNSKGLLRRLGTIKSPSFSPGSLSFSLTSCVSDSLHFKAGRSDHSFYHYQVWLADQELHLQVHLFLAVDHLQWDDTNCPVISTWSFPTEPQDPHPGKQVSVLIPFFWFQMMFNLEVLYCFPLFIQDWAF